MEHQEKRLPLLEEDRALLKAFREGEPDALLQVYRAYAARVASLLRGGLHSESGGQSLRLTGPFELENGVQEVFVRAFEPSARVSYDGLRPYEGFLFGIARNLLRERARVREIPSEAPGGEQGAPGEASPLPEEELEDRELSRLLAEFLAGCDAAESALYQLRFDEGLGQEESARRLRITRIQLRLREKKLKQRLLAFMQQRGYLSGLEASGWGFGAPAARRSQEGS
jgi:RNA polymerase sigma-70 factor (ECF subfamily)